MRPRTPPQALDRRLAAFGDDHHDIASREQLTALGMSAGQIEARLAGGRLHAVHRGVYAIGRRQLSEHGLMLAAVLAGGPGAVLSHRSAAALWAMAAGPGPSRVDVTLPTRNGRARRPGLAIDRPRRSVGPSELAERDRIPVTTPARTLLDLAATGRPGDLARTVERAEQQRVFDLRAIEQVIADHAGTRGAARLVRALGVADPAPTRQELERRFLALCREHGLPRPEVNVIVCGLEVDFLWRGRGVIAETDGFGTHGTRAAFERDRERDAALQVAGFRVVRFTYRHVTRDPAGVAATVAALLGAARGAG